MAASSPDLAEIHPGRGEHEREKTHAMPSFRLLTSSAWLTLDSLHRATSFARRLVEGVGTPSRSHRRARIRAGVMACGRARGGGERGADGDERDTEIERLRTDAVARGNPARRQGTGSPPPSSPRISFRPIASPRCFGHKVDLHDHRRRPRQSLADTEEQVREEDPVSRWVPT